MNQHNIQFVGQIHNKTTRFLGLCQVSKIIIVSKTLTKAYQDSS